MSGRKKKNSQVIPIQPASQQRRAYKQRGRTSGLSGRRTVSKQPIIDDKDRDKIYYSTTSQNQKEERRENIRYLHQSVLMFLLFSDFYLCMFFHFHSFM